MGKLPESPFEARLGATLFLLLLGVADLFGAWQVRNFAAFTPRGVATAVARTGHHEMAMACCTVSTVAETPVTPESLDRTEHHIDRELLVQDTHVHVPVYAMAAGLLALIVLGLRLSSRARSAIIALLFAAPALDFAGLWGAHLLPDAGAAFGAAAIAGGFLMGAGYLTVLAVAVVQLWIRKKEPSHA
ncbi:MAG TPA: hypothetical protein VIA45_10355 [Thermoanaerobaculia bacterium]|jgi:hypothetical protein